MRGLAIPMFEVLQLMPAGHKKSAIDPALFTGFEIGRDLDDADVIAASSGTAHAIAELAALHDRVPGARFSGSAHVGEFGCVVEKFAIMT